LDVRPYAHALPRDLARADADLLLDHRDAPGEVLALERPLALVVGRRRGVVARPAGLAPALAGGVEIDRAEPVELRRRLERRVVVGRGDEHRGAAADRLGIEIDV